MLALLLLAAAPETAIDAEHAFNAAAQRDGQWTAFRAFMAPDATVFVPQPAKAADVLPNKNPPIAVQWWPAESYVSCDGNMAVNTGPWVRPGSSGYFTTVWVRQPDGQFKWLVDGGDALATPRALPDPPKVRTAACSPLPRRDDDLTGIPCPERSQCGIGASRDGTLAWHWAVKADGSREFRAWIWNGHGSDLVVHDAIAAPPP